MQRKWILMLALILVLLTGCRYIRNEAVKEQETIREQETIKEQEADGEMEEALPRLWSGSSSVVLEDEKALYLCADRQIRRLEKESHNVDILWESETNESFFAQGRALLVNDKIYFVESEPGRTTEVLSVIGTDGMGYKRLDELENQVKVMCCFDGTVYIYSYRDMRAYGIGEDGELSFSERLTESVPYKIPEGYQLIKEMSPFGSVQNYGCLLLLKTKDYKCAMIDPQTGEEICVFEDHIEAMNKDYFLFSGYNEAGNRELYLTDAQTLETKLLTELDAAYWILEMDEDFVYIVKHGEGRDYLYERISLDNGEGSELFTIRAGSILGYYAPSHIMDFTICNGYMYYSADKDYAMYFMRRNVEHPDTEEILGEPYFDTRIGEVGRAEPYYEAIYSQVMPEVLLGEIDLQRLVIDEKFAGASEINRVLNDYQENCISSERNGVEWMEEMLEDRGEELLEEIRSYRLTSSPSRIFYFDGDYFSFYQDEDDYVGGIHGMLDREGFTFDLRTGDRLCLTDIIGNSEAELKKIVTEYFAQYIAGDPEYFFEDALETVKERISLDSSFYLSEKGICFYFEPYALASFAAGFPEVIIPYGEFEMKLDLSCHD